MQIHASQKSQASSFKKIKYDFKKAHQMIQGAFSCFDVDGSGCLKKTQFIRFLKRVIIDLGGQEPSIEECEDILWDLDRNGDGQISKEEILVLFKDLINIMGGMPHGLGQAGKNKRRSIRNCDY